MTVELPTRTTAPQVLTGVDDGRTGSSTYDGWYTLRLDEAPDVCGCGSKAARFPHTAGKQSKIIVWEESDGIILKVAIAVKKTKRSVRVVEYEPQMGRCISSTECDKAHI